MTTPDRIYAQYRNKPKAVAWYRITPEIAGQFETVYNSIRLSYDIDHATFDQLDVLGRIVVIDRSYEANIKFDACDWGGSKIQFGGKKNQFRSPTGITNAAVSDEIFRKLIKAKIAKNNSDATIDSIITALEFITGDTQITVNDPEDMTFSVTFGKKLSDIDRTLLTSFNIVPKPQGVRFSGFTESLAVTYFGGQYGWGNQYAQFGQYFGA